MFRLLLGILIVLLVLLQYRLWIGEGSYAENTRLKAQIAEQQRVNQTLEARNLAVQREVEALREGTDAIEARAREELGLIKEGETFYLFQSAGERPSEEGQ